MPESLYEGREENPMAKQWEDLADQIASHSTVDGKGDTVYLGREVDESDLVLKNRQSRLVEPVTIELLRKMFILS